MAEVLAADPRNAGVEMSAYTVGPDGVVIDLYSLGLDRSRADVFRVLLQFAERVQEQSFADVVLAYRGEPRFLLEGTYFRELGQNYSVENPIYTMRTFPFALRRLDGSPAFTGPTDTVLGSLSAQLEAFSQVHDEWYLADELARQIGHPPDTANTEPRTAGWEGSGRGVVFIPGVAAEGTGKGPALPISRYVTSVSANPMTDESEVVVALEAEEPLWTRRGQVRPVFLVRCADNTTDAYIHFDFSLESDRDRVRTRIRFDGAEPERISMTESTSGTAAFFRRPIDLLREMFEHTEMLVEVEEFRSGSRVARFDLEGLEEALEPIREHCNWTVEPPPVRSESSGK